MKKMFSINKKISWKRLIITIIIVFLTAGVTGVAAWYCMNNVSQAQKETINSLKTQIDKLNEKNEDTNCRSDEKEFTSSLGVSYCKKINPKEGQSCNTFSDCCSCISYAFGIDCYEDCVECIDGACKTMPDLK